MIEIDSKEKIEIVRFQAEQVFEESVRYSNLNWKNPMIFGSFLLGAVSLIKQVEFPLNQVSFYIICIFLGAIASLGHYRVHFGKKAMDANRKVLIKCRDVLKLFDSGIYTEETILPEAWKHNTGSRGFHIISHGSIFTALIASVFLLWSLIP